MVAPGIAVSATVFAVDFFAWTGAWAGTCTEAGTGAEAGAEAEPGVG